MNYPRACLRPAESNSMLEPGVSTGVHSEARWAHQPPWRADPSPPAPRADEGNDENDGDVGDAGMIFIYLFFIIMACTLVSCLRKLPRRPFIISTQGAPQPRNFPPPPSWITHHWSLLPSPFSSVCIPSPSAMSFFLLPFLSSGFRCHLRTSFVSVGRPTVL